MKKFTIHTLPCYLKALAEAIDVFSKGEEGKQRPIELTLYLIQTDKKKEIYLPLVPMDKVIKECGTNNTSLPKPKHWILGSVKLLEKENER